MRRTLAILLLLAGPAFADWTERVSSGGVTTGRYRWARVDSTANDDIIVSQRGSTHVNALTAHRAPDTMITFNSKDYGGTGTDVQGIGANSYGSVQIDVGQKESGIINSRGVSVHEDYNGGGRTQIDINANIKGGVLGYSHDVATISGVSRWFLGTSLASAPGSLGWHGSAAFPTTGPSTTSISAFGSGTVLNEGCVSDESMTPAVYGLALASGTGAVRLSRLTTGTQANFEFTPTSWLPTDTREVGQCFMVGAAFVGIVYNSTRGETFVGITDDGASWDSTQVLAGEWVGGATYDGTGYIAEVASPFAVYTSDGTTAFATLGDPLPSAPAIVTVTPENDGVEAWLQAASIYEYSAPAPPSSSGALRSRSGSSRAESGWGASGWDGAWQ